MKRVSRGAIWPAGDQVVACDSCKRRGATSAISFRLEALPDRSVWYLCQECFLAHFTEAIRLRLETTLGGEVLMAMIEEADRAIEEALSGKQE